MTWSCCSAAAVAAAASTHILQYCPRPLHAARAPPAVQTALCAAAVQRRRRHQLQCHAQPAVGSASTAQGKAVVLCVGGYTGTPCVMLACEVLTCKGTHSCHSALQFSHRSSRYRLRLFSMLRPSTIPCSASAQAQVTVQAQALLCAPGYCHILQHSI